MTRQQRTKLLCPIRTAVRGWAFGPDSWLEPKIRYAESLAADLPPGLQAEALEIIRPLRNRQSSR